MTALELDVGQTATRSMHVTEEQLRAYAGISGDRDPLLVEEAE